MSVNKKARYKYSLSTKVFVLCFSTVMATFFMTTGVNFYHQQHSIKLNISRALFLMANHKEEELNNCFYSVEHGTFLVQKLIESTIDEKQLMESPAYRKSYDEEIKSELEKAASGAEGVSSFFFILDNERFGSKGSFVSIPGSDGMTAPNDVYDEGWSLRNHNDGTKTLSYVAPVYKNGLYLGIVGMEIDFVIVEKILTTLLEPGATSVLLSKNMRLIFSSDGIETDPSAMNVLFNSSKEQPSGKVRMANSFTMNGMRLSGTAKRLRNGMMLVIAVTTIETIKIMGFQLIEQFVILVLITLLAILIWQYAISHLVKPLNILTVATYKIARGKLDIDIPYKSDNEIGLLADSIRKMESQLQDSIGYIRAQTELERKAKEAAITESRSKSEFLATMYLSLHELDLVNDSVTEIHSHPDVAEAAGASVSNAREVVRRIIEEQVSDQDGSHKDLMNFIDFDTLDERMKDRITISQEFLGKLGVWCRARFILVDKNSDGTLHHVLWAIENIDEEKRERENLQREAEKNAAASQAKSTFLANMSHEIRTPINAILGMNEMILREVEDDAILNYSVRIKNAGNTLLSIVNDILDFSKIEAGKMDIYPGKYDLSSVLVDLVNMISERASKKGLKLIIDADPKIPKNLFGDSVRIKQCAMNLLTNAVKYTKKGSVTFRVGFEKADHNSIFLAISVTDTGSGIKPEDMDKLFSPFERIEEGSNRTIEGTGLGMSIVQKTLAVMESKLSVKSEYGKGSEFSFRIRQSVTDPTELGDINESFRQSLAKMERYKEKLFAPDARILFVDDTEMNLEVVKGLLKNTKIKIDTVLSGAEALEKVRENEYDIIFIDHRMPEMDGIQTLHKMKTLDGNKNRGKPCISLTANAISGVKQMYLDEGFTDYLSKPVNPEKLEAMLRDYLPAEKIQEAGEEEDNDEKGLKEILSRLKKSNVIEYDTALKLCGNGELLLSTLRRYHDSIDEKAFELNTLFEAEDWPSYGIKVHALKSTSKLIGALVLSELARSLEEAADKNDADAIRAGHKEMIDIFTGYKEKLAQFVAEDDGDKPLIPAETLSSALENLLSCAQNFDIDGLDGIMKKLEKYKFPDDFKEKFAKIRNFVEKVDFNGLKELLSEK